MEIQFQPNQKTKLPTKAKNSRNKTTASTANKFIGVRQRPSGRWVAEIKDTTQKIRMWLGTFETAEEAARAYDEAACLLRGSNTRTNFATTVSPNSALASRIKTLLNSKKTKDSKPKKQFESSSSSSLSLSSSSSSSLSSSSSSSSPSTSPSDSGRVFDDVYKPDLSGCGSGGDDHGSWGFDHIPDRFCFAQELLELPKNVSDTDMSEFERMKVERQISASLYAINGVHEYMEAVYDPTEAFWDLPPLSPLLR